MDEDTESLLGSSSRHELEIDEFSENGRFIDNI